MNHIVFNHPVPDPGKAPHPAPRDRGVPPDGNYTEKRTSRFSTSGIGKPQFHAYEIAGRLEFQCDRCGGPVARMPGTIEPEQPPYVMYCNACDLTSGGWQAKGERERFLQSMTVG